MGFRSFLLILLLSGSCAFAEDLKLQVRQVQPLPLPFQPVNLVVEVVNQGDAAVRCAYPDFFVCITGWRASGEKSWCQTEYGLDRLFWAEPQPLEHFEAMMPLMIEPGHALRVQFTLKSQLARDDAMYIRNVVTLGNPTQIKVEYDTTGRGDMKSNLKSELEILYRKPSEHDAPVVKLLCEDSNLRSLVMQRPIGSLDSWEALIPKLDELIRNHPESGYAHDARLSLASWFIYPVIGSNSSQSRDRDRARRALEAIDYKSYPRGAAVLVMRRKLYEDASRLDKVREMVELLDKHYPDAMERLTDNAWQFDTVEEWRKAGTRKPYKATLSKPL